VRAVLAVTALRAEKLSIEHSLGVRFLTGRVLLAF
jgi:hypothetical protein